MNATVQAQLVNGYADGTFRANNTMTRMEMITMAVRSLDEKSSAAEILSEFADYDQIPAWGQSYAAIAVESGLLIGKTGNRLALNDRATRAEAVEIILRMLEKIV